MQESHETIDQSPEYNDELEKKCEEPEEKNEFKGFFLLVGDFEYFPNMQALKDRLRHEEPKEIRVVKGRMLAPKVERRLTFW